MRPMNLVYAEENNMEAHDHSFRVAGTTLIVSDRICYRHDNHRTRHHHAWQITITKF